MTASRFLSAEAGEALSANGTSPLHDLAAERAVIGAMLLDPALLEQGIADLAPADLWHADHGTILSAMRALREAGSGADLVTVGARLAQLDPLRAAALQSCAADAVGWASASAASFGDHLRLVRQRASARSLRDLCSRAATAIGAGEDPARVRSSLLLEADRLGASDQGGAIDRFTSAARGAAALAATVLERPQSLLGDGLLSRGDLAILAAKPGLSKTWLVLQLARACALGLPFHGLPTVPGGLAVGFLELELPLHAMQDRLAALREGGVVTPDEDRLEIVTRSELGRSVDLLDSSDQLALRRWCESRSLGLLVIDALSRAHTADENDARDFGRVLGALDALRHATGVSLLVLHHVRKSSNDARGRGGEGDAIDSLRGSGRLASDPQLVMRLQRTQGGLLQLSWPKVSLGRDPGPLHFLCGEDGVPRLVEAPASRAEANLSRVEQALLEAGAEGVSAKRLGEQLSLSRATVTEHLRKLDPVRIGSSRSVRYVHRTCLPPDLLAEAGSAAYPDATQHDVEDSGDAAGLQ